MQALTFRYSLPRLGFAKLLGSISQAAYLSPLGPTRLEEIPEPALLGEKWTVVRTALCGICGSDVKQVYLDANFDNPLTALISFPQVLGHEAIGIVEQVGPGVKRHRIGDRVVLNPWLSCTPRGIEPPCDACQRGDYTLCSCFTEGDLPPGMHAGNSSAVTGGYAPLFPAHESQLFHIPDSVSFEQAVLADPFSVSLHAILKAPPDEGALVLVYGAGVLGLLTVAALHALYPSARIVVVARYAHQAELAQQMGAERVIRRRDPAEVVESLAELAGARVYRPPRTLPWLLRGADAVYDTVGSAETLEVGIRVAAPRAPIVITGVGVPRRFEWTPLYFKEVKLIGSNGFGVELMAGHRRHAMEHYLNLVEAGRLNPAALVTHRYRLEQWQEAFRTLHAKGSHHAVKAVFDFGQAPVDRGG